MISKFLPFLILVTFSSCMVEQGKYEEVLIQDDYKIVNRFLDGQLHDTTKIYYPNGQLKEELPYQLGLLQGSSTMLDSLGKIIAEVSYKNDTILKLTVYNEEGQFYYVFDNFKTSSYDYYGDSLVQITYGHPEEILTYQNSNQLSSIADSVFYPAYDSMAYPPW